MLAQSSSSAAVAGIVQDTTDARIPNASVKLINTDTGTESTSTTGRDGNFVIPSVLPGHYRLQIERDGFDTTQLVGITLNVGDNKAVIVRMKVGSPQQTVTVDSSGLTINTTDASVSTVVDRKFVENMPLNGRSFQDLISMTPGVVTATPQTTSTTPGMSGDFSVNGQRTESNYYMIDGVAANTGTAAESGPLNGTLGVIGATSALGTTQSLLSVDALEEFRVESSTYSAEYGRSPGGQFTFLSRSGTNAFHGTVFDYLRNGYFDANNWFNDHLKQPKQPIHQNDFGGTFGGPVWIPGTYKGTDKTFFFISYEGLRLTVPYAASVQYVPDIYMREQAPAAIQPILNAFPLQSPTGIDYGTAASPSLAQFLSGYSLPGTIDSTSFRVDEVLTPKLSLFFRFGDTPSSVTTRLLSAANTQQSNNQTYTLGTTYLPTNNLVNEFRVGYARTDGSESGRLDTFGGATPIDLHSAIGFLAGATPEIIANLNFLNIGQGYLEELAGGNIIRQWNITDTVARKFHNHQLKLGADYRRIKSAILNGDGFADGTYESTAQVLSNTTDYSYIEYYKNPTLLFNQFALFVQDEWSITSKVNLSFGLRWDVDPPPTNGNSNKSYVVLGNLAEPSTLSLSSPGAALWKTPWYNFAPRLGLAWQAHSGQDRQTVIRAGVGVFFDTDNEAAADAFETVGFSVFKEYLGTPLPFTPAQQNFQISVTPPYGPAVAYPSHLQLPYTFEWNGSLEQGLGRNQTLTISYVGSEGRRLLQNQQHSIGSINPNFSTLYYFTGGITSNSQGLQLKFQRQVSTGLHALVSYTWSHSLDFGSNNVAIPVSRGNSDFDVRHNLQAGLSWDLPFVKSHEIVQALSNGWGLDGRLLVRTGFPISLNGNQVVDPISGSQYYTNVNVIPGVPIYLYGASYPGGRIVNKAAFTLPTGLNVGNAPRNFVRGFGENQINLAARRNFRLTDRFGLQFRAEAFNIFNHPIFGYINPTLTNVLFGQATQTLNQSLGTVSPQYQQGGPRSMQFALKLQF
jgi:hypothetical protein